MSQLDVYWRETKGNIEAIIPCALIAGFWIRAKHNALTEAHKAHSKKLNELLKHLDPECETDGMLDRIDDKLDPETPGGIEVLRKELGKK